MTRKPVAFEALNDSHHDSSLVGTLCDFTVVHVFLQDAIELGRDSYELGDMQWTQVRTLSAYSCRPKQARRKALASHSDSPFCNGHAIGYLTSGGGRRYVEVAGDFLT